MAPLVVNDSAAAGVSSRTATSSMRLPLRSQPISVTRNYWNEHKSLDVQRLAASAILSASLLCGQAAIPVQAMAAKFDVEQTSASRPLNRGAALATIAAPALLSPPPLASLTDSVSGVVAVAEEAEELAADVFHFLEHGVQAVGSTVHHLQVVHALERLEGVQLNQVVDLDMLKTALHPEEALYGSEHVFDEEHPVSVAIRRLDAALDQVADWQLRDVVDVGKLANALQDVPYTDPLDSRALQKDAPRIRRAVHWEAVADSVRPPALRQALAAFGSEAGSPFAELDMRKAVSAVRMDIVRKVLAPPRAAQEHSHSHGLESSGMWTWDSM